MLSDFFRLGIDGIVRKGVRSWLTMLGIFVGIAAVVSLISLGQGLQDAINEQFEMLGANLIYVSPGEDLFSSFSGGASAKLYEDDLDTVRDTRGVDKAGGMSFISGRVRYHGETDYTFIIGLPTDEETQDILLSGTGISISGKQTRFKPNDRYKAAVGYRWWIGDFFDDPVRAGDTIEIDGKDFEVVGEVSQVGNDQDDSQIYIPYDTVFELSGQKEKDFMVIMARVKPGFLLNQTAQRIEENLRKDRRVDEGEEDFSVTTLEDIQDSVDGVLSAVKWFLVGIAAISLFVGGVGIMNTMYTSVLERTKEIGLMKAVGAKNSDIRTLFLIESGIIGMLGGAIGCAIGSSLSLTIQYFASQDPATATLKASITPELIGGALLFSFLVGVISGVLPAIQASKLQPVDALRYE